MINKMRIDEPTPLSATQGVRVKQEDSRFEDEARAYQSHIRHQSSEGHVSRTSGDRESARSAGGSSSSSVRVREIKMEDVPMMSRPPTHGSSEEDGHHPIGRGVVGRNSTDWSSEWPARTASRGSRSNGHQTEGLQTSPLDIQHQLRPSALGVEVKRESSYTPAPLSPDGGGSSGHKVWDSPFHPTAGIPLDIPTPAVRSPQHDQFVWREKSTLSQSGPHSGSPFSNSAEWSYPSAPHHQLDPHYRTPSVSTGNTRHVSHTPSAMHRSPQMYHPYLGKTESGPSSLPDRLDPFERGFSSTREGEMAGSAPFGHPEYTSMAPNTSRKRLTGKSNTPAACSACKKAHLACDATRPCKRCTGIGRPEGCIDVPHKKRGRPKLLTTNKSPTGSGPAIASTSRHQHPARSEHHPASHRDPYFVARDVEYQGPGRGLISSGLGLVHHQTEVQNRPISTADPRYRRVGQEKGLAVSLDGTSLFKQETTDSPLLELEAVLTISNGLILTGIIPFTGYTAMFGDKGTVLDKLCVNYPLLDFVHPDDRDQVRDAVFCALVTRGQLEVARERERERLRELGREPDASEIQLNPESIAGLDSAPPILPVPIHSEQDVVLYLSQAEQHRGMASARIKDTSGAFNAYRMVVRNDPKQSFMGGRNDLVIGLERQNKPMVTGSTPSHISTPRSVHEILGAVSDSSSVPSASPAKSSMLVLPSFSELSAQVVEPHSWNVPGSQVPPPFPRGRPGPTSPTPGTPYELQQLSISAPEYSANNNDRLAPISPLAPGNLPYSTNPTKTPDQGRQEHAGYFSIPPQ